MTGEVRPHGGPTGQEAAVPLAERRVAALLLVLAFALRCFYIFRYRYDSDEPQHLHTTWGWTQGLLQYRDFFDNHTPLFHILFSPLVALLGERTDILDFMRFAMLPLWMASLWCVWVIGRAVFSRRSACWAVVLISLFPWWFYCALEYRTDNLWTPLWLGAVAVMISGSFTRARAFLGGFLLGLCFGVSMKTTLLCAVLAMAVFFTALLGVFRLKWAGFGHLLSRAWPALLGVVIVPALVAGYFWQQGAWEPFIYGTIRHNLVLHVDDSNHPASLRLVFPLTLPVFLGLALWIFRHAPDTALALRRSGLFLLTGLYYTALYSFWTLLTRQDYLPFYPLVAVLVAPCFIAVSESLSRGRAVAGLALLGLLEIGLLLGGRNPLQNSTLRERDILREVLQLTKPGDYVMDFKGECVFRQRAYRYVLEPLTYVRIKEGSIADTVAADLVAKHVCVVLNQDRWYPKGSVRFMASNYLAVGRMRVAGKVIANRSVTLGDTYRFEVATPASYVLWADGHAISGDIDGIPGAGARTLDAGPHQFTATGAYGPVAIFWSRAAKLGFRPNLDPQTWQYFR